MEGRVKRVGRADLPWLGGIGRVVAAVRDGAQDWGWFTCI